MSEVSVPDGTTLPSRPNRLSTPIFSLPVRDREVWLLILAESEKRTLTVRMSPMRMARWSLKKPRAPARQSELAW